jgi:hypothetical protein
LVVITPACGFVAPKGAMIIGVLAAVIPYIAVVFVKGIVGYDDALDTFGVHGVGGTLGAIMTGVLATKDVNSNLKDELLSGLLGAQLKAGARYHLAQRHRHGGDCLRRQARCRVATDAGSGNRRPRLQRTRRRGLHPLRRTPGHHSPGPWRVGVTVGESRAATKALNIHPQLVKKIEAIIKPFKTRGSERRALRDRASTA